MNRTPLAGLALLALTGCVLPVPDSAAPSADPSAAVEAQPIDQPSATASARVTPSPTGSATPTEPLPSTSPVAERSSAVSGIPVEVAVFPIKREPRAIVATIRVMLKADDRYSEALDPVSSGPFHARQVGGITLVDTRSGLVHRPSTIDDEPICGPPKPLGVKTNDVVWVSCVFGALPTDTTKVTVQFGPFWTFDGVPVG